MQLGTRWTARTEIPRAVPAALHAQIAQVEQLLPDAQPLPRWTLTWLEGRAYAELDSGVIVSQQADGSVAVRHDVDDEFA